MDEDEDEAEGGEAEEGGGGDREREKREREREGGRVLDLSLSSPHCTTLSEEQCVVVYVCFSLPSFHKQEIRAQKHALAAMR